MHFGKKNPRNFYFMGNEHGNKCELMGSSLERDFGGYSGRRLKLERKYKRNSEKGKQNSGSVEKGPC